MRPLVIYLNELSCVCEAVDLEALRRCAIEAVRALQHIARNREDTTVRLHKPLAQIMLGAQHFTLAAVLPGQYSWFSILKGLLNRSPCGPLPAPNHDVCYSGRMGIGLSWADYDDSFVLSFGYAVPWSNQCIEAERHTLDDQGVISSTSVSICNLSTRNHAVVWRQKINDYGKDSAKSSLLYRGNEFVIRMHLIDHGPPHVHIYRRSSDTTDLIAKVRIDNGDTLEGSMSSAMRREVLEVLARNRRDLLEGWTRLRSGQLPLAIC